MAFPGDYTKYQEITIDSAKVPGDLTDFPVFVNLGDLSYKSNMFGWWNMTEASGTRSDSHNSNDLSSDGVGQSGGYADFEFSETDNLYITNGIVGDDTWDKISGRIVINHESHGTYSDYYFSEYEPTGNHRSFNFYRNNEAPHNGKLEITVSGDGTTSNLLIYRTDAAQASSTGVDYDLGFSVDLRTKEFRIYVDGSEVAGTLVSDTGISDHLYAGSTNNNFYVGSRDDDGTFHYLDGVVKSACIWKDNVHPDKFSGLYNSGSHILAYADIPVSIFDTCRSDGGDIRVTKDDGTTELAREVATIDTTEENGELYLKFDGTLSSSSDTTVRLWYNGTDTEPATTATYGRNAVWSDYEWVFHFNEDPSGSAPQMTDSTGNGDLTSVGSMTSGDIVAGNFGSGGKGVELDGSNDYFTRTAIEWSSNDPMGITVIIKQLEPTNKSLRIMSRVSSGNDSFLIKSRSGSDAGIYIHPRTSASNESRKYQDVTSEYVGGVQYETQYGHVALTAATNEASYAIYKNATSTSLHQQEAAITSGQNLDIDGIFTESGSIMSNAIMDELRLSTVEYSANWVTTEHNNLSDHTTFYSFGTEQTTGGSGQNSSFLIFMHA